MKEMHSVMAATMQRANLIISVSELWKQQPASCGAGAQLSAFMSNIHSYLCVSLLVTLHCWLHAAVEGNQELLLHLKFPYYTYLKIFMSHLRLQWCRLAQLTMEKKL